MDVQQLVRTLAEHLVDAVESRVEIGGAQVTFLVGCKQTVSLSIMTIEDHLPDHGR